MAFVANFSQYRRALVDEVVTQGHQAIGAIRQQAEQLVEQEVGAVKDHAERLLTEKVEEAEQHADKIHTEKIRAVIEEGKAAIAAAESRTFQVVNQAEQQILLARQETERLEEEARNKESEMEQKFTALIQTTEQKMQEDFQLRTNSMREQIKEDYAIEMRNQKEIIAETIVKQQQLI